MNHIGQKIKELRKKKDMTQEKLAYYLNVSFQAVSKWETGISAPDISMIVPISRLLGVSTDELLGVGMTEYDKRKDELRELWGNTWETGDTAKRYEISKTAVQEYPGNFEFLVWLADASSEYAIHNCEYDSQEQREYFENAIKYYEIIIEDCNDEDIRNDAIYGYIMSLSDVGRRGEGIELAKQHPKADELLEWCLTGDEYVIHIQEMTFRYLEKLLLKLTDSKFNVEKCKAAENVIKAIIDDGNYLFFHDRLMTCCMWQAMGLTREKRYDEAIEMLKKSYKHAVSYYEVKEKSRIAPIPYTCQAFNKLTCDAKEISVSGTGTAIDDFREYLTWKAFDDLRDNPEFLELVKL